MRLWAEVYSGYMALDNNTIIIVCIISIIKNLLLLLLCQIKNTISIFFPAVLGTRIYVDHISGMTRGGIMLYIIYY